MFNCISKKHKNTKSDNNKMDLREGKYEKDRGYPKRGSC